MARAMLALLMLLPIGASAVLLPSLQPIIEIRTVPQNPARGETVRLSADIYSGNVNQYLFIWRVDGEVVAQDIGLNSLSATVTHSETEVSVDVYDGQALLASAVKTIFSGDIDLVWEATTYVPPLYRGRPLATAESAVRVLAIPHIERNGTALQTKDIVFSWRVGGSQQLFLKGKGQNFATINPPRFNSPFSIEVTAEAGDKTPLGFAQITIAPVAPRVLLYEEQPLVGTRFERALVGEYPFIADEVSVTAYPVFATSPSALDYTWRLNGAQFTVDAERPTIATFRKVGAETGTYTVEVEYQKARSLFERAKESFNLTF